MFLARRPSRDAIDRFLCDQRTRPLSYDPDRIDAADAIGHAIDDVTVVIGRGEHDFGRARAALMAWTQFDLGWVETFPRHLPVAPGADVAVLIRHLGVWSLNGCRVLYSVGSTDGGSRWGFAYGTLTSHAESGEELFEVFIDPRTDDVCYRIRAVSWPQVWLARLGYPVVRLLQARFRRDSAAAMKRAVSGPSS